MYCETVVLLIKILHRKPIDNLFQKWIIQDVRHLTSNAYQTEHKNKIIKPVGDSNKTACFENQSVFGSTLHSKK